jgi:hypothetical protein
VASRSGLHDAAIERLLVDVGAHLDDPQPVALATRVRARVGEESTRRGSRVPRLVAAAGFGLVAVLAIVLAVSSGTRDAVADWLGLRGISIEQRDDSPPTKLGADLALGDATTLEHALDQAGFRVLVPRAFDAPDEVYVAAAPVRSVTLLYDAGNDLPPAAASGVGLLLTEFRADVPDELVRKIVSSGVELQEVNVGDVRGYWFEGEPHVLSFADEHGNDFEQESRLAGNTLVWERGPLTLRLESGLSRSDAIRVAESLTAQP